MAIAPKKHVCFKENIAYDITKSSLSTSIDSNLLKVYKTSVKPIKYPVSDIKHIAEFNSMCKENLTHEAFKIIWSNSQIEDYSMDVSLQLSSTIEFYREQENYPLDECQPNFQHKIFKSRDISVYSEEKYLEDECLSAIGMAFNQLSLELISHLMHFNKDYIWQYHELNLTSKIVFEPNTDKDNEAVELELDF